MVSFSSVVSKSYNVIMYFVGEFRGFVSFLFVAKKAMGYVFSDSFLLQV